MRYLHGAIIADVIIKVFGMFGAIAVSLWAIPVGFQGAFGESATDFVCGGPHHLCVMAYFKEVVPVRAVREIVLLQEPRLGCKHPASKRKSTVSHGAQLL